MLGDSTVLALVPVMNCADVENVGAADGAHTGSALSPAEVSTSPAAPSPAAVRTGFMAFAAVAR